MTFLPFDDEATTIAHFIAGFMPQVAAMAAGIGCDLPFAARIAALALYREGWRTSTLPGGVRIAHRADNPIPSPLDHGPGPGTSADVAA